MVGFLLLFIVLIVYTVWDNYRITIVEQEIVIENLPEELDGFTILQVTDLHEREFGKDQKRLLAAVNSIDYQAIVFTGDMLDSKVSTNYKPFYSLVEGLDNKEHALYIPGNADPKSYRVEQQRTIEKDEFIKGMEQRGVKLLESIHTVREGTSSIQFVEFELSILDAQGNIRAIESMQDLQNPAKDFYNHRKKLFEEMVVLDEVDDSNVLIALNHYPVVDQRIDYLQNNPNYKLRDFNLIMAGHYHGGQIRLPFIGALFVPEPWYKWNGLFPPKDRVKGLWEYKQVKQYVSTGLGSSDAIPFLKFRFLNPPQINVVILRGG